MYEVPLLLQTEENILRLNSNKKLISGKLSAWLVTV
jgi:hypothetical protein